MVPIAELSGLGLTEGARTTWSVPRGFAQAGPERPFGPGPPAAPQPTGTGGNAAFSWVVLVSLLALVLFLVGRKSAQR